LKALPVSPHSRFLGLIVALLAAGVVAGGRAAAGPPAILVSRQLLHDKGLHVGDTVRLAAESSGRGAQPFVIAGVYEPTPDPARFAQLHYEARLHLPNLLALTADPADPSAAGAVGAINVALANRSDATSFARDVAARLPGALARATRAADGRSNPFVVLERFHQAIAIVTVLGSAVFLLALMVMLVDERRATVGTLRLIGLTRSRILAQMFAEGTLIALAGAAFGVVFALATEGAFNRFFQWRYDTALVFLRVTPRVVVQSVLIAVPLGILASLAASWTILRQPLLSLIRR
jgi:putative ABC transport system permease protein